MIPFSVSLLWLALEGKMNFAECGYWLAADSQYWEAWPELQMFRVEGRLDVTGHCRQETSALCWLKIMSFFCGFQVGKVRTGGAGTSVSQGPGGHLGGFSPGCNTPFVPEQFLLWVLKQGEPHVRHQLVTEQKPSSESQFPWPQSRPGSCLLAWMSLMCQNQINVSPRFLRVHADRICPVMP